MASLPIKDTFDTACLIAYYRALASERPDARIHDPYARLLAGERGAEIMQAIPLGEAGMWAILMRTSVYDDIIVRLIKHRAIDTIINLGAGLDTRPYRLSLPASFCWIDADRSEVLAYKKEKLAHASPVCEYIQIPLNITDDQARKAFFAQIDCENRQILVLTEGLLAYLAAEQVASIAIDLREQPAIRWWLTEFISPATLERDNKAWNTMVGEEAQIRFAPAGGLAFFQLYGWHVAEFRYFVQEALRLRFPLRKKWLARLFSLFLPRRPDVSYSGDGFVLLKREESHFITALPK
jgi:methyltransferase (TIGR00027 family)